MFDSIRRACRRVTERARFVALVESNLADYARSLSLAATAPAYDPIHHFLGEPEATVAYVLTLDAVNFGSGYFPHLNKRPGMSGYFTVASHLKDRFEARGPFAAQNLTKLTPADCAELFGQTLEHPVQAELMSLFARALNHLGEFLDSRYGGSFTALVTAAEGSAERLASELAEMPFFQDVSTYSGFDVPLYKRAQITPSDLALAFGGEGYGYFHDLNHLTIFADNLVPHVLRLDGILEFSSDLTARIDRGELVPAGSPEEVEIRAVALYAVERLVEGLRGDGHSVTAQGLDVLLWNRGRGERYKARPRHRTRTVFY